MPLFGEDLDFLQSCLQPGKLNVPSLFLFTQCLFKTQEIQVSIKPAWTPPATARVTPTISRKCSSPLLSIFSNVCRSLTIVYPASVKASCSERQSASIPKPITTTALTSKTNSWPSAEQHIFPTRLNIPPPLRMKTRSHRDPKD